MKKAVNDIKNNHFKQGIIIKFLIKNIIAPALTVDLNIEFANH